MYDLRVGPVDAPELAVECVGAVDPKRTETWNIGPAKGPLELAIKGDWLIQHTPTASIKALRQRIEPLLQQLESRRVHSVLVSYDLKRQDPALFRQLESLNVTHVVRYREQGTGKADLQMTGIGGVVDSTGGAVSKWIGDFLCDPSRRDVLSKLQQSKAADCHVVLFVSFGGAPWPVESYLMGNLEQLPSEPPQLPPPVTGVWIASGGRRGLRWDGNTWQRFDAHGQGIDE